MFEEPKFTSAGADEEGEFADEEADEVFEGGYEPEEAEAGQGEALSGAGGVVDEGGEDEDQDDVDESDDADDGEDEALEEDGSALDDELGQVNRLRGGAAKAVLEHVTRMLVDDPESVVVDVSEGRSGLRFSVHVAQGDMGRVIGRRGRTAQAIRTLVRAAAASEGVEASVDIVD